MHLLTVHSWGPGRTLLRLSHSYEEGEDAALSGNVTVSLKALFAHLTLHSAVETTSTGNQPLSDVTPTTYQLQVNPCVFVCILLVLRSRLCFVPHIPDAHNSWCELLQGGANVTLPVVPGEPVGPGMLVTLTPMSIRTFLCDFS